MSTYVVCSWKESYAFDTAREVASFLWGKDLRKHAIFKDGMFVADILNHTELSDLENYLENYK